MLIGAANYADRRLHMLPAPVRLIIWFGELAIDASLHLTFFFGVLDFRVTNTEGACAVWL